MRLDLVKVYRCRRFYPQAEGGVALRLMVMNPTDRLTALRPGKSAQMQGKGQIRSKQRVGAFPDSEKPSRLFEVYEIQCYFG